MKPEPLKGKIEFAANFAGGELVSKKEDIKSAVEWLKERVINKDAKYGGYSLDKLSMLLALDLIDEAFEDVTEQGGLDERN